MADVTGWGPYCAVHRIGEGGMGVVHLARDASGRSVAVKALRPAIVADPAARRRLAREVEALRRLRHPRIAKVLDADLDADVPYLVTEFVPGPSLDAAVAASGALSGERLRRLGGGLLEALTHLHDAGIVHRDVKPANVVLRDDDPVLIDFGIAHLADASRITSAGLIIGTPGYLSPEAAAGGDVDERADWWGWAATLAFAATGRPPFGAGAVPVVLERIRRGEHDLDGVARPLRDVLADALGVDPSSRPGPRELLDALGARASGGAGPVVPPLLDPARPAPTRLAGLAPTRLDVDAAAALPPTRVASTAPTVVLTTAGPALSVVAGPAVLPSTPVGPPPPALAPIAAPRSRTVAGAEPAAGPAASPVADPGAPALPAAAPDASAEPSSVLVSAMVVASGLLLAAGAGVAPMVAVPAAALAVLLARLTDRVASARARRRAVKGPARGRLVLLARLPADLGAELLSTASALTVPALLGLGAAWGLAALTAGSVHAHDVTDPVAAAPAVAFALVTAWIRPESAPLRSGSRRLARAAVRTDRRAGVALALAALSLVAVAVALALGVRLGGG